MVVQALSQNDMNFLWAMQWRHQNSFSNPAAGPRQHLQHLQVAVVVQPLWIRALPADVVLLINSVSMQPLPVCMTVRSTSAAVVVQALLQILKTRASLSAHVLELQCVQHWRVAAVGQAPVMVDPAVPMSSCMRPAS